MPELGVEHVEAKLAPAADVALGRDKLQGGRRVDEPASQPCAGHPVHPDRLTRDPRSPCPVHARFPAALRIDARRSPAQMRCASSVMWLPNQSSFATSSTRRRRRSRSGPADSACPASTRAMSSRASSSRGRPLRHGGADRSTRVSSSRPSTNSALATVPSPPASTIPPANHVEVLTGLRGVGSTKTPFTASAPSF